MELSPVEQQILTGIEVASRFCTTSGEASSSSISEDTSAHVLSSTELHAEEKLVLDAWRYDKIRWCWVVTRDGGKRDGMCG